MTELVTVTGAGDVYALVFLRKPSPFPARENGSLSEEDVQMAFERKKVHMTKHMDAPCWG